MRTKAQLMDEAAMNRALMRISHEIAEKNKGVENVVLVGILRRGEPIARQIRGNIEKIEGVCVPCGSIDIGYYRDDLRPLSDAPQVRRTELPFAVEERDVVLIDDVLYTGRTARAAIEAVFSCGRPRSIQFAVLVDCGHGFRRAGCFKRQRPGCFRAAGGAGGPGTPGTAHPRRLRGQKRPHLPQRAGGGPPARIRRGDRRLADGSVGIKQCKTKLR